MKTRKKILITLLVIFLVIVAIVLGGLLWVKFNYVGKLQTDEDFATKDIAANMVPFENHKVTNIALLGLDIKRDLGTKNGRSDAVMILTIDREHKKIKLSSIARDTYVKIDRGNGNVFHDKLTHAHS